MLLNKYYIYCCSLRIVACAPAASAGRYCLICLPCPRLCRVCFDFVHPYTAVQLAGSSPERAPEEVSGEGDSFLAIGEKEKLF